MSKKIFNRYISLFFIIYFFAGLAIYRDFGVGIEEHFHRQNGFYWLIRILSFLNFDITNSYLDLANIKYQEILASSTLPNINYFNFYGIIFDVPLALIETVFSINDSKIYFELRHLSIFIIFFLSSIFFYKIINLRLKYNIFIFLGLIFYIGSPRIFGDSFHNNKDILFLSFLTISVFYLFNFFKHKNNINLILFCLFSALASSSRIMGIYLPLIFFIFQFIEYLSEKISLKNYLNQILKILFFFILFLYLHYPYVWEFNFFEISKWFKSFFFWMDIKILFNGDYYPIKYLPRFYLPLWILITTPVFLSILSIFSIYILSKRFFMRVINLKRSPLSNSDFWSSNSEKYDVFILVSFLSFLFFAIFLNVAMLSGWRHFYFLHLFISYLSIVGLYKLYIIFRKKINLRFIFVISILMTISLFYSNITFHPFQSLYFNRFLGNEYVKNFQVDTPSLSRSEALKFIYEYENESKILNVGNASWTPLRNGADMLPDDYKNNFIFVGHELKTADYIYTNFIYKSDEKYNKSYNIPNNFKKIKELKINNVHIYSIYKKIVK